MKRQQKKESAIKLNSISKQYLVYHQKPTFIENILQKEKQENFWALKNITLDINKGEKIGIVGDNGSGKTTLLKIISGISTPTKGSVQTQGKLVSLIDLNAGFHPELTGLENIFINGLLLGMSKKEIKEKLAQIIAFADIDKFIDAPFYTYSTGMRLRLGFSVCIHTDADIFLFDEGIYAGDLQFQKKIYRKLKELFSQKKVTFLVTTHLVEFLNKYCQKCLWIEKGKVRHFGPLKKTVKKYQKTA